MSRSSYIIAVTGGRDYDDKGVIVKYLLRQMLYADELGVRPVLLTGGCPTGVDEVAREWWHGMERPYVVDPARFGMNGRSAGPTRNKRMAIGATFAMDPPLHPDVLLRFPGGRDSQGCEDAMRAMGVPIVVVADHECGRMK